MAEQYGAMQAGFQAQPSGLNGPPASDSLGTVVNDFNGVIQRIAKLHEAMRMIGDRVNGVRPEPVGNQETVEPTPSSLVLDLRRKHGAIGLLLSRCENEAQRLAASIGMN